MDGAPCHLAAAEGVEGSERGWEGWCEGVEVEGLRGVEAGRLGGVEVGEGKERGDCLIDRRPAEGTLVSVVIGWIDAFSDPLSAGGGFDGSAVCCGDVGRKDAGE